ncbi:hypothetical protein PTTG_29943, partial [Puccinia triticina 1-1 BBBD Race 1]
ALFGSLFRPIGNPAQTQSDPAVPQANQASELNGVTSATNIAVNPTNIEPAVSATDPTRSTVPAACPVNPVLRQYINSIHAQGPLWPTLTQPVPETTAIVNQELPRQPFHTNSNLLGHTCPESEGSVHIIVGGSSKPDLVPAGEFKQGGGGRVQPSDGADHPNPPAIQDLLAGGGGLKLRTYDPVQGPVNPDPQHPAREMFTNPSVSNKQNGQPAGFCPNTWVHQPQQHGLPDQQARPAHPPRANQRDARPPAKKAITQVVSNLSHDGSLPISNKLSQLQDLFLNQNKSVNFSLTNLTTTCNSSAATAQTSLKTVDELLLEFRKLFKLHSALLKCDNDLVVASLSSRPECDSKKLVQLIQDLSAKVHSLEQIVELNCLPTYHGNRNSDLMAKLHQIEQAIEAKSNPVDNRESVAAAIEATMTKLLHI